MVTNRFLSHVNLLHQTYGTFVGRAKAKHSESEELKAMDDDITQCFVESLKSASMDYSFKLVNIAIGKMLELLTFIETLEATPPENKVPKASFDKVVKEKDELKKTIEIMVQYKGLPELNSLLETARNYTLPADEHWVLALCSSNLIEATVNKKLEKLGEKAEGSFEDRYKKLCRLIKEKEDRDVSHLLPLALYKGVRNKLDHATDSNSVTPKEAKDIGRIVKEFLAEIFQ